MRILAHDRKEGVEDKEIEHMIRVGSHETRDEVNDGSVKLSWYFHEHLMSYAT